MKDKATHAIIAVGITVTAMLIALAAASCDNKELPPQTVSESDVDIIRVSWFTLARMRTPGGWLVFGHHAAAYVPDAEHTWEWKKP